MSKRTELLPWYTSETVYATIDDEETASKLMALPDRPKDLDTPKGYPARPWTKKNDEDLLFYWPFKVQSEVARIMKRSLRSCIDRYAFLTKRKDK